MTYVAGLVLAGAKEDNPGGALVVGVLAVAAVLAFLAWLSWRSK